MKHGSVPNTELSVSLPKIYKTMTMLQRSIDKFERTVTVVVSTTCIVFTGMGLASFVMYLFDAKYLLSSTALVSSLLFFAIHIAYETEESIYGMNDFLQDSFTETEETE